MAAYEPVIPEDISNIEPRVTALEETIYEVEVFQIVSSGTSGTVTIPAGGTIIPSQYAGPSNCFLATVSGGRPDDAAAIRTNGDQVFCALAMDGSFVFSNSPKTYPVAIVYQVAIMAKDLGNIPLANRTGEMMDHAASGIEYFNLNSQLTATNVQSAIDEEAGYRKLTNSGVVTVPTYTANPDGTLSIGSNGVVNVYKNTDFSGGLYTVTVPALSNLSLTNGQENYVHYDAATNAYQNTTNIQDLITNGRKTPVFRVSREGTELHVLDYNSFGQGLAEKAFYKNLRVQPFDRVNGFVLQTAATRVSTITAGAAYFGVKLYSLGPNVAGTTGQLFEYYRTGGAWTSALVTQYDSTYYDDGASRQTLSSNRWVSKYFYRGIESDNHAYYTHGGQYNTLTDALNEPVPTPPALLQNHALYVGKIVIQQGATNGTAYPRAWEGAVVSAGAVYHNDLLTIQQAASGVTHGHISDSTQDIYGQKNFRTRLLVGTDIWDSASALQVDGSARVAGNVGIGSSTNTQTALRIDLELSGDTQSGIRNYVKFTAGGSGQYHGCTSDPNVAAGVTLPIMYHASYGDSFNLGTIQTCGYLRMAAPTNTNYTSFFGIISAIPQTNSEFYFLRHVGAAKSVHLGPLILGAVVAHDGWSTLQLTGNATYTGFTKLGSDAPAIKVKELTGTTGAAQGNSTTVAHGLTGDKIISITAVVRHATNSGMPPEHQATAGFQYSVVYDATNAAIKLSAANSAGILSKSFSIFITYKE